MLFHGEKCRHCRGNMSEPKPITEGSRKGGYRTICGNCGHIEYHAGNAQQAPPPVAGPSPGPVRPVQQAGQPRRPIVFTG
jgi:hypothetical protein